MGRRTLSQKRKRKWRPKTTLRKTQTRSNPGSVSKDEHLPHSPLRGADSLVEDQPKAAENKDGEEVAEKMDSNTHTSAEDMKDNEKEDKVEAALKTMQAMGFSDDGGWLSSLLRAKSGDVGKVLDTIKPSVLDRYYLSCYYWSNKVVSK